MVAFLIFVKFKSTFKASRPKSPAAIAPKKAGMAAPRATIPPAAPIRPIPMPPAAAPMPLNIPPLFSFPPALPLAIFLSILLSDSLISSNTPIRSDLSSKP